MNKQAIKFDRKTRNAVCAASEGLPSLSEWLRRMYNIGNPLINDAIEGIWCGREGVVRLELPGANCVLVMQWYNGKVETSYLS